jgi:hypothetical protein
VVHWCLARKCVAATALDAMEEAERELNGNTATRIRPVRLGAFASASLTRALRAGTLDLALLADVSANTPPDDHEPALAVEILSEGPLRIAVSVTHRLAGRSHVGVEELAGERWAAARSEGPERLLGVWPSAPDRPDAPYLVRDWLTKLRLVATGAAITTIPDVLMTALPPDVRAVSINDSLVEHRRLLLARTAGPAAPESDTVASALRDAAIAP